MEWMFGTSKERTVRKLLPLLDAVREEEPRIVNMSNAELRAQTAVLKEKLSQGATLDELLPYAFAVVRETAKRVVGLRPFDVQIIGGIVLHQGGIAEMVTGEGKTLVATMPVYLNALTGNGVHIVTVNDYLARRDAEWMGPIYQFLGLSVGLIQHDMELYERQVGYRADITYGTNNEFGFDYLRDNMSVRKDLQVQRGLNYAIVDEVDSILIDEARTPLIISGRPERSSDIYVKVDEAVRRLRKGEHYEVDEKQRNVLITDEGMEQAEHLLGVDDLFTDTNIGIVHIIEQSIRAHNLYHRDKDYIVQNGEVLIVDEFTGRALEGRRYSDGLHQAIEAKERVPIRFESQTIATITYQNYFRMYKKLAGMTGTAITEALEFSKIYGLEVIQIPTNLPLIREDLNDLIFATENGKFHYVVKDIKQIHESGRPILVGTVSIEKSEKLAELLQEAEIHDFQVLNAKHHEREAAIIANAGKKSAITIATNMAGRGTDIKLAEGVRELGGLFIVGTERHEARRIDNQLRGRSGRQGDPGTTRFYVSLEDEVARLFGGDRVKRLLDMFGSNKEIDEQPLSQRMVSRSIERAQRQVEEYNYEIRKHLLEYDEVMDKQRKYIYSMRQDVLEDKDVTGRLQEMFSNIIADAIDQFAPPEQLPEEWDMEGLHKQLKKVFGIDFDLSGENEGEEEPLSLQDSIFKQVLKEYERRHQLLEGELKKQYEQQTKDTGSLPQINFKKLSRKRIHDLELMVLLRAVDEKWIDHLYEMDYLRESVRLRAYGQRDPLLEYKQESFELFQNLIQSIELNVVQSLFRITDPEYRKKQRATVRTAAGATAVEDDPFAHLQRYSYIAADKEADRSFSAFNTRNFALGGQSVPDGRTTEEAEEEKPKHVPVRVGPKVGPNDPCPCGSGKKYKKCCGKQLV